MKQIFDSVSETPHYKTSTSADNVAQQTILMAASHLARLAASETSLSSEALEGSMSVPDLSLKLLPNETVYPQSQF